MTENCCPDRAAARKAWCLLHSQTKFGNTDPLHVNDSLNFTRLRHNFYPTTDKLLKQKLCWKGETPFQNPPFPVMSPRDQKHCTAVSISLSFTPFSSSSISFKNSNGYSEFLILQAAIFSPSYCVSLFNINFMRCFLPGQPKLARSCSISQSLYICIHWMILHLQIVSSLSSSFSICVNHSAK